MLLQGGVMIFYPWYLWNSQRHQRHHLRATGTSANDLFLKLDDQRVGALTGRVSRLPMGAQPERFCATRVEV